MARKGGRKKGKVIRPTQLPTSPKLDKATRRRLAAGATYVGSREHKTTCWWGGLPGLKVDRHGNVIPRAGKPRDTICPLASESERQRATRWVRIALRLGNYRFTEGDKDYPKHIWYQRQGVGWFGFCVNGIAGEYKGWPLEEKERRAYFR